MTASSAGGSTCLTARGLDISLAALRRQDPYIKNIVDVASQVALYTFNSRLNEWEKTDVEGTLFVYTRLASPRHGFTIQNRLSMDNLTEPITKDLDFQLQDPFLLYRNARLAIHGVWFYDKQDCQRIAQLMKNLTQQEQVLAQPQPQPQLQGGWRSPGTMEGGGKGEGEGKGVDILQMLTNARCDYDKGGKPEPKEILCSTLHDNPNLIKPIPVKPTSQDSEGTEPRQLSLATLFGSQLPCLDPYSPRGQPQPGAVRPAVARSLSYEDPDGKIIPGSSRTGVSGERGPPEIWPAVGTSVRMEGPGSGLGGVHKAGEGSACVGPNQPQQQHCPAIQKLMTQSHGQRGAGELLQPVSQSSEIRLWQNGAPLLHHHRQHQHQQHHLIYQQHLHHHHHHQQHQQQFQSQSQSQTRPDPIQRLFQNQPPMSSSVPTTATLCGSHPPPPLLQQPPVLPALQPAQPRLVDSQGYGQLQQPVFYSPSRPQGAHPPQPMVPAGPDPTPLGTDLPPAMQAGLQPHGQLPGMTSLPGVFHPTSAQIPALSGQISGMPGQLQGAQGVVSPHELLQRLQLVQQEQRQGPPEPPRPSPGLAPRFPAAGPSTAGLSPAPASSQYSSVNMAQRAGLQLQVISPQRIPATVAPTTLLLSPSVFSQSKAPPSQADSCPLPSVLRAPQGPEDTVALSRSQLQATLLHLIQTDSSFLDTIYKSYISRLARDKGSTKY